MKNHATSVKINEIAALRHTTAQPTDSKYIFGSFVPIHCHLSNESGTCATQRVTVNLDCELFSETHLWQLSLCLVAATLAIDPSLHSTPIAQHTVSTCKHLEQSRHMNQLTPSAPAFGNPEWLQLCQQCRKAKKCRFHT